MNPQITKARMQGILALTVLDARRLSKTFFLAAFILVSASSCKKSATESVESTHSSNKKDLSTVSSGNIWYDKFVAYNNAVGDTYYNLATVPADSLGWQESYMLRSYLTMYEVTKNTSWLNDFVQHSDKVISRANDTDGDGYLDWKTKKYSLNQQYNYPYLVLDGLITLPMARFVRLINQTPSLQAAYQVKATSYRTFIEDEIAPKWSTSASYMGNCWNTAGYYREPANFDSLPDALFSPLPYNMMAPFALMLWTMYDVNGSTNYKTKADAMAQYLANGLSGNSTGYTWKYCNITPWHVEDTSHGNLDVEFATEAFQRGIVFTGTHMQGFTNTLIGPMWNDSETAPTVTKNIDGTEGVVTSISKQLYGWLQLTAFNAKVWTIAAEQYRNTSISGFSQAHTMAQIIAWDPAKVQNQGFDLKSFSDATLPARWIRLGSPTTAIVRSTAAADKVNGAAGLKITSTNDGVWQGLYQETKGLTAGQAYEIRFYTKATSGSGSRVYLQDPATSTAVLAPQNYTNTTWTLQSFQFTAPASGRVTVYLENKDLSVSGTAYFDDVIIKRVGDAF